MEGERVDHEKWGSGACKASYCTMPSAVGVTFPSGEAQEQLICSLYQPAGLDPESLEYIEAHGTGTKVKALSGPYL